MKHERIFNQYAVQIRIAFGEPWVSALLGHADCAARNGNDARMGAQRVGAHGELW